MLETRNLDHYIKVCRARENLGLKVEKSLPIDHPLVGKTVTNGEKTYVVEKAFRQWMWGWYVSLLLNHNNSHCLVFWENVNCGDELVLRSIHNNRDMFTVLDNA